MAAAPPPQAGALLREAALDRPGRTAMVVGAGLCGAGAAGAAIGLSMLLGGVLGLAGAIAVYSGVSRARGVHAIAVYENGVALRKGRQGLQFLAWPAVRSVMVGNVAAGAATIPFFAVQMAGGTMIELPDALAERAGQAVADLIAERAGLTWVRREALGPGFPAVATKKGAK